MPRVATTEPRQGPQPALGAEDGLSLVAHDMRASLTVIHGFALTLAKHWDRLDRTEIMSALDAIARRSHDLTAFADDLLDLSRAQAGKLQMRRLPCDVVAVVREAVEDAGEVRPGVRYRVETSSEILVAVADARRIGQVVTNLLSNAARHAGAGSEVLVMAIGAPGGVTVSVTNRGRGIDPSVAPLLFEKFPRPPAAGSGGAGLGLYLCRLIVEAHDGHIAVTSEGDETTFGFWLPSP